MPTTLPYNQLQTAILAYLERYDDATLIANFPVIVMLAQARIDDDLKALGQVKTITGTFAPPNPSSVNNVLAKPSDWKYSLSFEYRIGTGTSLETVILKKVDYDTARFLWPDDSIAVPPVNYADDQQYEFLYISPPPDQPYEFRWRYIMRNSLLDPTTQTNWLTQNAYRVLFDATLLETIIFLKNSVRLPEIQALYDKTVQNYRNMDLELITGSRSDRSKI